MFSVNLSLKSLKIAIEGSGLANTYISLQPNGDWVIRFELPNGLEVKLSNDDFSDDFSDELGFETIDDCMKIADKLNIKKVLVQ